MTALLELRGLVKRFGAAIGDAAVRAISHSPALR